MVIEKTLVLLKPDALERGLIGKIISRLEEKGLKINAMKMLKLSKEKCKEHYAHLVSKPFYNDLEKFITSKPIIAMVISGPDAVSILRDLAGPTDAKKAPAGTIRGDFALSVQCNVIHASDSPQTAKKEIERFFEPNEIFEWERSFENMLYSKEEK